MRVGIELEGFVYLNGEPVDVYQWLVCHLGSEEGEINGVLVKTDAGKHMIELALPPVEVRDLDHIPEMVYKTMQEFPRNWKFCWQGYDPGNLPAQALWAPKQRYFAIKRALQRESPPTWKGVENLSRVASVHVHLDVDFERDGGRVVALLNTFNNADDLRGKFSTPERVDKWFGWADPRRLPNPPGERRIFGSFQELEEFIGGIPRLVKQGSTGALEPDLKEMSRLGDRLSEGTIWWWARARRTLRTVEIRFADSMEPTAIPAYVRELLRRIED
jgi:hypothetical protein